MKDEGGALVIYVIGSLRNPKIPEIANKIQAVGHEAFADWYGAGPEADDKWKEYEIERGKTYLQALKSYGAQAVFNFDKKHLERADAVVLVAPAGKSGHLELGWALGKGKPGYYLLDSPDRWDVMLQFATMVTDNLEDIMKDLDAKGLQQTSQRRACACSVCRKADPLGKSICPEPQVEGNGQGASVDSIQRVAKFTGYTFKGNKVRVEW